MGLMDRLFGKKVKETEEPQALNNRKNNPMNFRTLQRRDGTSIDIMPVVDSMGNQTYDQVFNSRTNQMQLLPKFVINSPEIEKMGKGSFTTILMDINKDLLDSPEGAEWISNGLLSSQRIEKVINTYGGYAGGLAINENGQITGKYIDEGVVNGLKISKQQQWEVYQANQVHRDEQAKAQAIANAEKYGVNIKTSHAEDLSL